MNTQLCSTLAKRQEAYRSRKFSPPPFFLSSLLSGPFIPFAFDVVRSHFPSPFIAFQISFHRPNGGLYAPDRLVPFSFPVSVAAQDLTPRNSCDLFSSRGLRSKGYAHVFKRTRRRGVGMSRTNDIKLWVLRIYLVPDRHLLGFMLKTPAVNQQIRHTHTHSQIVQRRKPASIKCVTFPSVRHRPVISSEIVRVCVRLLLVCITFVCICM